MSADITEINEYAARLKNAITDNKLGFDKELLPFVQRYALVPEIKKTAVLNIYKLVRNPDNKVIKTKTLDLIDTIVKEYSAEQYHQQGIILSLQERQLSKEYEQHREVTFSCLNLQKSFKKDFTLGEIDIEIRRGDITGVVGENGNGKTTLFRIIAGDLAHDEGEVHYPFLQQSSTSKHDIDWGLVKSRIAFVPQELPSWHGNLRYHLQYEAAIHGIKGKDNLFQVEYIIERLGLRSHIEKNWKQLSGGFKFRFALAKALVWQPDMMILDEPLANLDIKAQLSILHDIKHLATSVNHPIAVFISSQHIHEIEKIADNLIFLRDGKVIFNDSIENLGISRNKNIFEIGAFIDYKNFITLFSGLAESSISYNGFYYIVETPLSFKKNDILKILISRNIELNYFRDISCSSKKLFV